MIENFLKILNSNSVVVASIIAVLTTLVGAFLSAHWTKLQKRRELALALANAFYASYGEFCAIWKYWNRLLEDLHAGLQDPKDYRDSLLDRASKAEGGLESALLKVAAERKLDKEAQANLGNLRQAYQVLRERIQTGEKISYGSSDHPDYVEFKRLVTWIGVLLASHSTAQPTAEEARAAFLEITDNKYESRWKQVGR